MFAQCRQHLIDTLGAAGMQQPVYTSLKRLKTSREPRLGAVLAERETFSRDGARKRFCDEAGQPVKRTRAFVRDVSFSVIIGEYTAEKAEEVFDKFLVLLGRGTWVNGNYAEVEVGEAEWVEEEDSILAAKIAVQVLITYHGGLYLDTELASLADTEPDIST